jgi:hypothetical protein
MNSFKVTRKPNTIYASSLKAGQIGIIAKGIHAGLPVMRTSTANFFILTTGEQGYLADTEVTLLTVGETITLTVGDPELDKHILELLRDRQKINAIKERRKATSEGLKEAKEYVETLEKEALADGRLVIKPPYDYSSKREEDCPVIENLRVAKGSTPSIKHQADCPCYQCVQDRREGW